MNKRIIFLAAITLAALGAPGCSADASSDDGSVESEVNSSKQRTKFAGVSVGFGDKATSIVSKLQAKGVDAKIVDITGYGDAVEANSGGLKLTAMAAGGRVGFRILVEGDDYKLDIRDEHKTETMKNGAVKVPSDVASALENNALKFGSVSIELGSSIKAAAEAMGTMVREQNNYGTAQFIFDFNHNGDPVAVTSGTNGQIRDIEIVHTESTGGRSRPIITTTHFTGDARNAIFNRTNDREGKEEKYSSNGEHSVSITTSFN